ncbi:MAG: prepilin-type N-terminal cleavage/methylation domain-containing protein [Verrucomicrobium sp.]|nr:type II secretion system protein [Verrucomicrobium sp.]
MKTKRRPNGYSLIEVLVASALVGVVISATVSLAGTMNLQGETAEINSVAINYQDNAARLWQLGLTPAEVLTLMPHVTNNVILENMIVPYGTAPGSQVSFTGEGTTTLSNSMGTVEDVNCAVTIRNPVSTTHRELAVDVYRPSIR